MTTENAICRSPLRGAVRWLWLCLGLSLLTLTLPGCNTELYDWGGYEKSVDNYYLGGADFSPNKEIDRLRKEVERSERNGSKVPPGKYAQLGYLCYQVGDREAAGRFLTAEKTSYPSSAAFIDRLLEQMR